jgi:hypothetical protein
VADGWCWFVLREEYCWLVAAGGWFVLREKYCWLVADKPSEQAGTAREIGKRWRKKMDVGPTEINVKVNLLSELSTVCICS